MTVPAPAASQGSRTTGYLVAGVVATIPAYFVIAFFLGLYGGIGGELVLWIAGIVWLLKKRQEDPSWDRRPTNPRGAHQAR